MAIPEKIKCTVTNWDYIYNLCRDLSLNVVASGYEPDVIVALARGGWFAGRMACDLLGISDLVSLKVEHYVGTAQLGDECIVRYPLAEEMIKGKQALIVDDIADTGKSLRHAFDYVKDLKPADCKTSVLQLLFTSEFTPDYYAEFLEDWTWVVYPWNFIEDMIDLILKLMTKERGDVYRKAYQGGIKPYVFHRCSSLRHRPTRTPARGLERDAKERASQKQGRRMEVE
jgi:hypothetical protein